MYDIQQLINNYKYGIKYVGELNYDTISALEDFENSDLLIESLQDKSIEIYAQLPGEDELDEILDILSSALKLNKPEMVLAIKDAIKLLEVKTSQFFNSSEYANEILNKQ